MSLTALILFVQPLRPREEKPKPVLDVRVADQNGRMRVDWDPRNPIVLTADGATLEVKDGALFNRYPVEASVLRSGGLDYVRRHEDVLLTLTIYKGGTAGPQSSIRRIPKIEAPVVEENKVAENKVAVTKPPSRPRQSRARRR